MFQHGMCRLCGKLADLRESHIVPAFVYRTFKATSGTEHIRFAPKVNRRVQDGQKLYLLCTDCEERFSAWETEFADTVFRPLREDPSKRIPYGQFMLKFCTSVSWRVLQYRMQIGDAANLPKELLKSVTEADTVWKEFLLGKRPHPGKHEQHFLHSPGMAGFGKPTPPPNINRYLLRTIDIDLALFRRQAPLQWQALVYSKLMEFIILGFVEIPRPRQWVGTKVHVNAGIVQPEEFSLPDQFQKYLYEAAKATAEARASISERQQEKIDEACREDIDRFAQSETFRAMRYDHELFGDRVFDNKKT